MFGVRCALIAEDWRILREAVEHGALVLTDDTALAARLREYGVRVLAGRERIPLLRAVFKKLGRAPVFPGLCVHCGGTLTKIAPGYWRCNQCGHLYWRGSHYKKILKLLEAVRRG